jgi:hypothetical protein
VNDRDKAAQLLTWLIANKPELVPAGSWARPADKVEDTEQATDAVIVLPDGEEIPVAYREWQDGRFRALHLRYVNQGQFTEFGKIKGGEAKWYLYAWHDGNGWLVAIYLVDLDRMRARGWFEPANFNWRWPGWLVRHDTLTALVGTMMHWLDDEGCVFLRQWFEMPLFRKSYSLNDPAPQFGPPTGQASG